MTSSRNNYVHTYLQFLQQYYLYFNMYTKKHSKVLPKETSVYHQIVIGIKCLTKKVCNKYILCICMPNVGQQILKALLKALLCKPNLCHL